MNNALKNNNQNDFDHKLFQIDCQRRGPFVIPIKKDQFEIIQTWDGFYLDDNKNYYYKGHKLFLL